MFFATKSNNSGPCLTNENEIVANRIYIIEEGQPIDLKDLFIGSEYVSDNTYTKSEVDTLLIPKANSVDVYTKSQTDIFLNFKANTSDMINVLNTKANIIDVTSSLAFKANSTDVYTKTEIDSSLLLKANILDIYTKTQIDSNLLLKANISDIYTKTEIDSNLLLKANILDIYSKSQIDSSLLLKSNIIDVNNALALKVNTADFSNVANTKPSDLPVSTATITMLAGVNAQLTNNLLYLTQTKADISNPIFPLNVNIVGGLNVTAASNFYSPVSILGLNLYGISNGSALFDTGNIQHKNRLKFAISTSFTPSDLETKIIIDSTAIYLKTNTFCYGDMTFSGLVNGLTSSMIGGLNNIDNTSDVNKPVSTLQQAALNLKANIASPTFTGTVGGITASMIGLGNVNNTTDINKPISTLQQAALNLKANLESPIITGMLQIDSGITKIFNFIDPSTLKNTGNIYSVNGLSLQGGTLATMSFHDGAISVPSNIPFNVGKLSIKGISTTTDGNFGCVQHNSGLVFAISTATVPTVATRLMTMDIDTGVAINTSLSVSQNFGADGLTTLNTCNLTGDMYTDGYIAIGNVAGNGPLAGNDPLITESALQVCNYRVALPTQFGVHLGTDYGTWDCGISLCSEYDTNKSHIDFTYAKNTSPYLGQIGYDNTLNNMTFITNKIKGMVLDSTGRLTLGTLTPGVSGSALSVNGSSYVSGAHLVKGTITGQENLYLSNLSGKIGVGVGSAESSIHTANLKVLIPSTMGIHLGMDSATGAAGIEIVAASTTQNAYIDFTYPGVANRGKILYSNNLGCMTFTTAAVERMRLDNVGGLLIGSTASDSNYKLKVIGPVYFSAAISGPTSIATTGAITSATLTTTANIVCGGTLTGATSIITSGAISSASLTTIGNIVCGGTLTSPTLTTTGNIVCGGTLTGATAITTSGDMTCYQVKSTLTKQFDISHPTKDGMRLRHRCIEGPLAYLYYPYQYQCVVGLNTFDLPDYFDAMNTDVMVHVSPFKHFGSGWGETINNTLNIYCNTDGYYNIQVVGTRSDPIVLEEYANNPVEYIQK